MTGHGYTKHGHPCCGDAVVGDRPSVFNRCGGPAICGACALDAASIHAAIESPRDHRVIASVRHRCNRIDAESRKRVEELDAAHGCEASAEREFHRGQLVAVAEIMKVLGS